MLNRFKFFGLFLMAALLVFPAAQALAQFQGPSTTGGGFTGPGPEIVSVKDALAMKDDSVVTLKGNIVKHLGDEMYTFQDASGSVSVEIDQKLWQGQVVNPTDVVLITGEVDKDWNKTTIDASAIIKQ